MKNHKSCHLERVAHVYLIWHKNHLSENAKAEMVNFITSMQDELHSGTKLNSGMKAIQVSKLIKSSLG